MVKREVTEEERVNAFRTLVETQQHNIQQLRSFLWLILYQHVHIYMFQHLVEIDFIDNGVHIKRFYNGTDAMTNQLSDATTHGSKRSKIDSPTAKRNSLRPSCLEDFVRLLSMEMLELKNDTSETFGVRAPERSKISIVTQRQSCKSWVMIFENTSIAFVICLLILFTAKTTVTITFLTSGKRRVHQTRNTYKFSNSSATVAVKTYHVPFR
jgi:hypothetical protein